jgi:hypothetical protein
MKDALKQFAGVDWASCQTCMHLRHESDGDYGEYQWLECGKHENYSNLKSFPFKKEMKCWAPSALSPTAPEFFTAPEAEWNEWVKKRDALIAEEAKAAVSAEAEHCEVSDSDDSE